MGKGLIAALAAVALAALVLWPQPETNACGYRPQAGACDGWSAGRPKAVTIAWLYMNDTEFADWLLGHNEHGQAICGWQSKR